MRRCETCGDLLERYVKAEHVEDLGGVVVKVRNAVKAMHCPKCNTEMTAIPDLDGLMWAAAISRALNPIRLRGREVKFMRRALDVTQAKFAEALEIAPETVSRWENDVPGIGGMTEKVLRHYVCALLYKRAIGRPYDPEEIARMRVLDAPDGHDLPPLVMERVRVQRNRENEDAWDEVRVA
jgi:DNA-binding transcriptional regulator YiaG